MEHIQDITTPTLVLDVETCRRNIARMASKMSQHAVLFRPHFKTHQSRAIGRWFREAGVRIITVSSLQMARYFADDGWDDITIAIPVNLREIDLLNALAKRVTLNVVVEDPDTIGRLDAELAERGGVLLKIDVGTQRTGIHPSNAAAILACVNAIDAARKLVWHGLLAHAGHTYQVRNNVNTIEAIYHSASQKLGDIRRSYSEKPDTLIISFGDTPGASLVNDLTGFDEMRPGNFVFYDLMQSHIGSCEITDVAVRLYCPVIAVHQKRNECVLYGGAIHLSKDYIARRDGQLSFGNAYAVNGDAGGVYLGYLRSLSQEHGVVMLDGAPVVLRPGDLVSVVPIHSCLTAQCMGGYADVNGNVYDHFASDLVLKNKGL